MVIKIVLIIKLGKVESCLLCPGTIENDGGGGDGDDDDGDDNDLLF